MPIATGLALGIGGALAAGGSIAGSAIGASAAGHAADTQASAADRAAQLQYQESQNALALQQQQQNFQQGVYQQQQQNFAPWLQSGTGALASLNSLLGIPVSGFDPKSSFAYDLAQNPGGGLVSPGLKYDYPNAPAFNQPASTGLPQAYTYPGNAQAGTQPQQFSTQPGQLQIPNPAANPAGSNPTATRTSVGTNASGFRGTNTLNNGISSGAKSAVGGPAVNTFGGPTSGLAGLPTPAGGMQQNPVGAAPAAGAAPGASPTSGIQGAIGRGAPATGQPVSMSNLLGGNPTPGGLLQGWNQQFQAPTDVTQQNDPGYQFRLNQGLQALQNSAAARGGLLSGNTAQAINDYAQNYASNEYGNVYGRALGEYQQNYNIYNQNQANQYNRLASLAGVGQTAAGQLGSAGQAAVNAGQAGANNAGNIMQNAGQQIGNAYQNAGAATASGYVGQANAINGGLQGVTGSLGQYLTLQSLLGGGGGGNNSVAAYNPYANDTATGGGIFA